MLKKFLVASIALISTSPAFATDLVVYSSRSEHLIKPIIDIYEKETGNKVTLVNDKAGPLMQKLKAEGKNTNADVFITVDGGNLWQASQMGLLRPMNSKVIRQNIPSHLRDPNNQWTGLSVRARTIFYNPKKVKPSELSTYADLASPKWKGRLCLRTSNNVYNQSLVGTMIYNLGIKRTEQVVKGWVNNLAAKPFPKDTALLESIGAGRCDVGIANTYYYGRLVNDNPKITETVQPFFADQNAKGTHVNVSGAGIVKYSKHPAEAQQFIEWLSGGEAQAKFASLNHEFPANPRINSSPIVISWGSFKQDIINVSTAGKNQKRAIMLMKKAGYQ